MVRGAARIWRDGDEAFLKDLLQRAKDAGVTGVMLGDLGHFPLTRDCGLTRYGDFGLNVFNARSLEYLEKGNFLHLPSPLSYGARRFGTWKNPLPLRPLSTAVCP